MKYQKNIKINDKKFLRLTGIQKNTFNKILSNFNSIWIKLTTTTLLTINANIEVIKRNELHSFVLLPKRWVVERSFAFFKKCRRLWKNCERKLNTSF